MYILESVASARIERYESRKHVPTEEGRSRTDLSVRRRILVGARNQDCNRSRARQTDTQCVRITGAEAEGSRTSAEGARIRIAGRGAG